MFTKALVQFITHTNYEDLPKEVVAAAKIAVLDHIGVAMAGSQEPSGQIICQMVRETQSPTESTVIGHRFKTNPALAALANGTSAHVLDYDDCMDFPHVGLGHPSTSILPAVIGLGEKLHISGRDLLIAYCLGIEAYGKIGLMTTDAFREGRRWEWTGVLGAMGSAAAIAKVLKLNENQTDMCLGIEASMASGMIRNFGCMAGHLHAGHAARNAIEAGLLAQKGFTGYGDIIEAPRGFYNTLTGNQDPIPDQILKENAQALGNPWILLKPALMFKAFPCAHISHFGVTAGIQLRKEHQIDWKKISEIEFRIPTVIDRVTHYPDPKTGVQARFAMGYCLSRTLIEGKPVFKHFTDEAIYDPTTRGLMKKIKFVVMEQDLKVGSFGYQEVILKMQDGSVYSTRVDHAKGEPQNPQTQEEFTAKYLDCATYAHYDNKTASQIQNMVMDMENVKDISNLTALFLK